MNVGDKLTWHQVWSQSPEGTVILDDSGMPHVRGCAVDHPYCTDGWVGAEDQKYEIVYLPDTSGSLTEPDYLARALCAAYAHAAHVPLNTAGTGWARVARFVLENFKYRG